MTEKEIIKAKAHYEYGIKCDIFSEPVLSYANTVLEVFDAYNRQQAKIGRLQRRNSELEAELDDLKRDDLPRCKDALRRANEMGMALEMENQALKAEIERLEKLSKDRADVNFEKIVGVVDRARADIKVEAIKEFAERLKIAYIDTPMDYYEIEKTITNLVKEMVGDTV